MRDFAIVVEEFWTGRTGKALRDHAPDVRELALYLVTGPNKSPFGLYYKPMVTMTYELGRSIEAIREGLLVLSGLDFARFDVDSDFVWVLEMAAIQFRPLPLKPGDYKIGAANRWYRTVPRNRFLARFFDRYADDLHLDGPRRVWEPTNAVSTPTVTTQRVEEGAVGPPLILVQDQVQVQLVPTKATSPRGQQFEQLWQAYPKAGHVGKKAARDAFDRLKPTDEMLAKMLAAIEEQKQGRRFREGFVPALFRWLSGHRWEDEIETPGMTSKTAATVAGVQQWLDDMNQTPGKAQP